MSKSKLYNLLQLNGGTFPSGGFSQSWGLETYVYLGRVNNAETFKEFMETYLISCIGKCEGPIACEAYELTGTSENEFDEEKCDEIIKGSLLHDIGKIFIPLNLTNYPYRFCNEEYEIIKTHCCISWKIVHTVFSKTVQDICLYHHEKPNGTGYVESLNLYKLPKEVFLVQVADIYEALTAERTYKKGYMSEYALNIIDGMTRRLEIDDTYVQLLVDYLSETENQEENSL